MRTGIEVPAGRVMSCRTGAGGGVGAGANTVTRGQQVQIESETVVRFKLSDAIIVHVTTGGGASDASGPPLERHDNQ
jgi:cell division GTPase FtsZ